MPEGRMLMRVISESKKLAALPSDSARLLYTWLMPWVDREGRHSADPEIIKGRVFPKIKAMTPAKIDSLLSDLNNVGLIVLYRSNGELWLEFTKNLQRLPKEREAESSIPSSKKGCIIPPNSRAVHEDSGVSLTNSSLREEKGREEKRREVEEEGKGCGEGEDCPFPSSPRQKRTPPPPPLPQPPDPEFSKFLEEAVPEIKRIFNENGFSHLLENKKFYDYLLLLCWNHRFLELGTELERKLAHLRDKPPGPKSNLCVQFRNWFRLAVKYEEERRREHRIGGKR